MDVCAYYKSFSTYMITRSTSAENFNDQLVNSFVFGVHFKWCQETRLRDSIICGE